MSVFEDTFECMSVKRCGMHRSGEIARLDSAGSHPEPPADSLSAAELSFQTSPPRKPQQPIKVLVWLRFRETTEQAQAECIEFTSKAALVRFELPSSKSVEQVWVWANAVTRWQPS